MPNEGIIESAGEKLGEILVCAARIHDLGLSKLKENFSYEEDVGDIIVHFDENGKPLFMEILKASKVVPLMVQSLAKKEVIIT
ncbi:MAG: DUF2283 domain-containing protein [Candidatus Bathyarchaeota archaeon]|nr:DUF2283 domain-containing protein [Candidatus Bathyarchaeota archaeon]